MLVPRLRVGAARAGLRVGWRASVAVPRTAGGLRCLSAVADSDDGDAKALRRSRIAGLLKSQLWPSGEPSRSAAGQIGAAPSAEEALFIKRRVATAGALLLGAKASTIAAPFLFKEAVDGLGPVLGTSDVVALGAVAPSAVLVGYGLARLGSSGAQELRNFVFSAVSQRAIRRVARGVYEHLHSLPLAFHLDRNTGQLARVVDRGARSINYLVGMALFNVVPTGLEICLVSGILASTFGAAHAAAALATVAGYVVFTVHYSTMRIAVRKRMNAADSEASGHAIDRAGKG